MSQLTDFDYLKSWLTENTTPDGKTYSIILYSGYVHWMQKQRLDPLPLWDFGAGLRLLNISRQRDRRGSLLALKLKPSLRPQPARPAPATKTTIKKRLGLR